MKQQKVQKHFKVGKVYYYSDNHDLAQYIKVKDSVGRYMIIRMYGMYNRYYGNGPTIDGTDWYFSFEEEADELMLTFITGKHYEVKFK